MRHARCQRCGRDVHRECLGKVVGGCTSHTFSHHTYTSPTCCGVCDSFLIGVVNQGFRCSSCGLDCHSKCRRVAPSCAAAAAFAVGAAADGAAGAAGAAADGAAGGATNGAAAVLAPPPEVVSGPPRRERNLSFAPLAYDVGVGLAAAQCSWAVAPSSTLLAAALVTVSAMSSVSALCRVQGTVTPLVGWVAGRRRSESRPCGGAAPLYTAAMTGAGASMLLLLLGAFALLLRGLILPVPPWTAIHLVRREPQPQVWRHGVDLVVTKK